MIPQTAEVVIVGGGIVGCATAYALAQSGVRDVVVLERSYLASGSTGRSGAGVRHQWGTEMNCRLAADSIRRFESLPAELDYPDGIEFKQGGYLILAWDRAQLAQLEKNVALQRSLGIEVDLVDADRARDIVPHLNPEGLAGATFCPKDGHVNPFRAVDAYARAARRRGAKIMTGVEVVSIEVGNGRVDGVITNRGPISCNKILNAAGPYSAVVAEMAGVNLPVFSERHQILVTEPVDQMQGPMVLSQQHGLYCQQVPGGNFLMGLGEKDEPPGFDISAGWRFLVRVARAVAEVLPPLTALRVIRQWAGLYNISPDRQPILGPVPEVDGLYLAVGFSGHGFMVAPAVADIMAAMMTDARPHIDVSNLDIGRFDRGELVLEPAAV